MNGFVYLMGESNNSELYKIGATKKKNIDERKNELQTGNPNEIVVLDYFETTKPYKLEKILHNHFKKSNELNEWFRLDKENVKSFKKTCQYYQDIIDALTDNPFFKWTANKLKTYAVSWLF